MVYKRCLQGGLYMSNIQEVFDRFDMVISRIDKVEANINILAESINKKYDLTPVMEGIKLVNNNMLVLNHKIDGLKTAGSVNKADIIVEINKINESLNCINDMVYELTREDEEEHKKIYTDAEIYELKKQLSWSKLVDRTGWKKSTLQWHYYKYVKENGII